MADASMTEPGQDVSSLPPTVPADENPLYGGYTRFELELEVRFSRIAMPVSDENLQQAADTQVTIHSSSPHSHRLSISTIWQP